jgi:glycosyltransferase involved in cell wall biosynthesis
VARGRTVEGVVFPVVSVVMPTFNHGHLIARAIESVRQQTYPHWELLVIDNHSTDNTQEVVDGFKDPRVRILKIHNNGIIAASRNMGVAQAVSPWVAFLDSDDWWESDKLAVCVDRLGDAVDVLYHDLALVGGATGWLARKKIQCWQTRVPVLQDLLVRGNALATSAVLARRELLLAVAGKIVDPQFSAAADFACWLNLAQLTDKFEFLPRTLGAYLLHGQGVSRRDMSVPTAKACEPFLAALDARELRAHKAWIGYARGRYLFVNGQPAAAMVALRDVLKAGACVLRLKASWMMASYYLGFAR